MKDIIRWGIMGTGNIANKFVKGLLTLDHLKLRAVGSRDLKKAEAFSRQYGFEKAYGSYEELVSDPDVDIVYISTPHPFHKEGSELCLNAGKAVICEKPFTLNAKDSRQLVKLAREKHLFLMEAMWTRYIPVIVKVREWIEKGLIGDIHCLKAEYGAVGKWDPSGRLFDLELGGGALLDIGIYPVSFASMIFGEQPSTITSLVNIGKTGVDERNAILFGYDQGKMANLMSAINTDLPNDAWIFGTKGHIRVPYYFRAKEATLSLKDGHEETFRYDFESTGYQYEAQEAMDCLRNGRLESDLMPLDETIAIMETMDKIRAQWNLRYPQE